MSVKNPAIASTGEVELVTPRNFERIDKAPGRHRGRSPCSQRRSRMEEAIIIIDLHIHTYF
jgi:hypothetical protein